MKKRIITTLFILSLIQSANAQRPRDVFSDGVPITWLGLDFSQARFIGDNAKFKSVNNTLNLFDALNDLMATEKDKYDIGKMLRKPKEIAHSKIMIKLDVTRDHNAQLDVASLLADSTGSHIHLQQPDIRNIVSGYDFKGNTGIGLMFNIETFNKTKSEALIWVTFINMNTKEVLITERLNQEPGGFGLRNFWAGAIYDMMKRVRKTELKKWQIIYVNK